MTHVCHLPGCSTACPPAHLFCIKHWGMVPAELKREVIRTAGQRGAKRDASWAPWWRAQAQAVAAVQLQVDPHAEISAKLDHAMRFAARLEGRR